MTSPRKLDDHDESKDDLELLYQRFKALTDTKQVSGLGLRFKDQITTDQSVSTSLVHAIIANNYHGL